MGVIQLAMVVGMKVFSDMICINFLMLIYCIIQKSIILRLKKCIDYTLLHRYTKVFVEMRAIIVISKILCMYKKIIMYNLLRDRVLLTTTALIKRKY